jgi:uncharacterized protein
MLETKLTGGLEEKRRSLHRILQDLGQCIVAFSGGVDSSLLAAAAYEVLGSQAIAVTAKSPSLPLRELRIAEEVAQKIGIRLVTIDTYELDNPEYAANNGNRCYFCKDELFDAIERVVAETGIQNVTYGENFDDLGDIRPGRKAALEHGVKAPLKEAGFTKDDVRQLARYYDLPVWDKPAFACLSSRFPVGTRITSELLKQVEQSEDVLWSLGFRQFRVRHHGDIARIEVPKENLPDLLAVSEQIVEALKGFGYRFITMDLAGFRSGSLNRL